MLATIGKLRLYAPENALLAPPHKIFGSRSAQQIVPKSLSKAIPSFSLAESESAWRVKVSDGG